MSTRKVKIGLVGCGSISQFAHLPALAKADYVTLTALCEGSEDLLNAMGDRHGVQQRFTDYDTFLSEADVDAVILAIADRLHVPLAIQALESEKHVLVEKPLGVDVEDCKKLVSFVDNYQKILQVGYMKRYDPGVQYARHYISEKMGQRLSVAAWYCDSCFRYQMQHTLLPPLIQASNPVHPQANDKRDKARYYLKTHGTHVVDTIQFLGGPVAAVSASMARKFDCYSWHCLMEFADGAVGHLELTVHIKGDWREGFVVHGEHGSVEGRTFLPFFRRPSEVRVTDAHAQEIRMPVAPDSDPFERQLEAFARAILYGEPVGATAMDGLADAKVLEAIESAARSGRRIVIS